MQAVQSPIIPVVAELIRQSPGTISLGQGVVSYGPPREAIEQVSRCLENPANHQYKAVQGIPELVEAIETKLRSENGITGRVLVTAGGNMAFVNAVLAVADPGDEIILLTPYYFNHEMAVTIAGCEPFEYFGDATRQIGIVFFVLTGLQCSLYFTIGFALVRKLRHPEA